MRRIGMVLVCVAGLAAQTHDTTAPVLTALSLDVTTVNASAAAVPVTATWSATDDLSGVAWVSVVLVGPGDQRAETSGTGASGSVVLTIARYAAAGSWAVEVHLRDRAGNSRVYSPSALLALEFPSAVTVQ